MGDKRSLLVYLHNILPGHVMITLPLFLLLGSFNHIFWQALILLIFLLLSGRQQREGGQAAKPREGAVQALLRRQTTGATCYCFLLSATVSQQRVDLLHPRHTQEVL